MVNIDEAKSQWKAKIEKQKVPEYFFLRKKKIDREPRRELRQINYARFWEIADIGTRV